jgi:hypothetical protein
MSKKHRGNAGNYRPKPANSRASKIVIWIALLAIVLLVVLSVVH